MWNIGTFNNPCIVDLPIQHGDFPYLCTRLPEGMGRLGFSYPINDGHLPTPVCINMYQPFPVLVPPWQVRPGTSARGRWGGGAQEVLGAHVRRAPMRRVDGKTQGRFIGKMVGLLSFISIYWVVHQCFFFWFGQFVSELGYIMELKVGFAKGEWHLLDQKQEMNQGNNENSHQHV